MGAAGGFAVGGPIGAVLGGIVGHAYDSSAKNIKEMPDAVEGPELKSIETRRVAFATAMVILAAKLAKADGVVSKDEIRAFKDNFDIDDDEVGNVAALFNEAKQDPRGFEPYALQIRALLGRDHALLEEMLDGLFAIASADGVIHEAEAQFLVKVAAIFGFNQRQFEFIAARYQAAFQRANRQQAAPSRPEPSDYAVLGVEPSISDGELRKAHRKLVMEHHPDRLVAKGLPEEMVKQANDKLAAINAAFDRVAKQRGMN